MDRAVNMAVAFKTLPRSRKDQALARSFLCILWRRVADGLGLVVFNEMCGDRYGYRLPEASYPLPLRALSGSARPCTSRQHSPDALGAFESAAT